MSERILSFDDIKCIVKPLAEKYNISEVYIFGSYARNEATITSDIDFLVFGGKEFKLTSIFAFAEQRSYGLLFRKKLMFLRLMR